MYENYAHWSEELFIQVPINIHGVAQNCYFSYFKRLQKY